MKNIIPLVIAVILGLAAVFAVSRTVSKNKENTEQMVEIVAASRMLGTGETVAEAFVIPREVPMSALPKQHIKWENRSMIIGQKVLHVIAKGDYLLLSDVGMSRSMGNVIGDGEWGFPVSFADSSLVSMLQPGDEIAIVGTFKVSETVKQGKNLDAKEETFTRMVTSVIFPRVRILEITNSGGVFLSLPPQQALALTAISREAELYPLLRKTNDTKALNRKDAGIFENSALTRMIEGLTPIDIPAVPVEIKEQ
ncbi:MAG: hypothetical protein IKS92_14880 [Victivallales bacterium]|nr:hypothetical protein [Victivallales bacterium]MBR4417052.1 hypothetical protein [Victivallales bacterium]MBR5026044.1 hypothetical protein [Victivallales bacterium]MBR5080375.1 hypothetical protein [Victivallales bacterium]MBR5840360.1 hypothetical protein [Victivallales bacterium]